MKLHFNPGALLNKTHCGSVLAVISGGHAQTHFHAHTYAKTTRAHDPHKCIPAYTVCDRHTFSVCSVKPNEALQGQAAFCVFIEMMRGFVAWTQWNKRVEREGQTCA